MSTAIHSHSKTADYSHARTNSNSTALNALFEKAESSRFGIIALLFILIPCLAGIATSSALMNENMVLFTIAGAPAMLVETLILGLASMRSVLIASTVSVVISFIIIFVS